MLTEKDVEDTRRISIRLLRALDMNSSGNHQLLIQSFLQEAVVYGRTNHWILEEAAEKVNVKNDSTFRGDK